VPSPSAIFSSRLYPAVEKKKYNNSS